MGIHGDKSRGGVVDLRDREAERWEGVVWCQTG